MSAARELDVRPGEDWRDRIARWTGDRSAWAVQREQLDPSEYVELWLRDAGLHGSPEYTARYDAWLRWLDEQGVEAIGMGWITLHNVAGRSRPRSGRTRSSVRSVHTYCGGSNG